MRIEITHEAEEVMKKLGDKFLMDIEVCSYDENQLEVTIYERRVVDGVDAYYAVEIFNTGNQ